MHAHQHHDVHALPVERVVGRPEHLLPRVAQVVKPVVLADHHFHRRLQLGEDLPAEVELLAPPELRKVSAEQHEVRLRVERVDVLDRLDRPAYEALIDCARIQMRVRDVGECERRLSRHAGRFRRLVGRGVGNFDELKRMRRYQAPGHHGSGRRSQHFEKRAAVQTAKSAQDRVAILHVFRFDAFMPSSHRALAFFLSSGQSPPSSAGFSWLWAGPISPNGPANPGPRPLSPLAAAASRCGLSVRDRLNWRSYSSLEACSYSGLVRLARNATRSSSSDSVSPSGTIPPSRYGFCTPPLL